MAIESPPGDIGVIFRWVPHIVHPARIQFLSQDRLTFVSAPLQSWRGSSPDPIRSIWRPQGGGVFSPLVNLVAAPTQWAPKYPDWIARPAWRRPDIQVPQLFPTTVAVFGWRSEFPEQVFRRQLPTAAMQATAIGWQAINTVRLEWLPNYPDRHWTTGQKAPWHQVFDINLEPIPNPPSPDLAWGPRYDDWIARAPRVPWFQAALDDPRIMPPSPELAWRVTAPDLIAGLPRPVSMMPALSFQFRIVAPDIGMDWQATQVDPVRRVVRPESLIVRPPEVPVSPVVWIADRQDPPDAPRRQPMLIPGGTAPPGALIIVGARMGWQTPNAMPHARASSVYVSGGPVLIAPVLPPVDTWCVMFDDDAILAPALQPETMRVSTLAEQTVITPGLHSEEVC